MFTTLAVHKLRWLHTHTRLTALFPGLPGSAGTRKVKPIWILLKQETVSGSGISWAICKSAPCSRQTSTPAPHHSVFTGRILFLSPNQQCQSTEGKRWLLNTTVSKQQWCKKTNFNRFTRPNRTLVLQCFTIRYDTRCYFNVRSKADISQLNLPHGTDN